MNGALPPPPGPPAPPPPPPPPERDDPDELDDDNVEPTTKGNRGRIVLVLVAVAAFVIAGAVTFLLVSKGDDASGEVILQATAAPGNDPFTDSVANMRVGTLTSNGEDIAGDPVEGVSGGDASIESVDGSAPGLYGGTEQEDACDPDALVAYLEDNPDKAQAWADAQGIDVDEISDYVATLTPVILREDTRVTNNGFADGHATPFQAVLQAGTAVLVDDHGVPRARCACGNPLSEPEATDSDPDYTGEGWSKFDSKRLVAVSPAPDPVKSFHLVDVKTGNEFERTAGTQSLLFSQGGELQSTAADDDQLKPRPFAAGEVDGEVFASSYEGDVVALDVYNGDSMSTTIEAKSGTDGFSDLATLKSSVGDVQVVDDRVFWTGDNGLGSIGLDGSDERKTDISLPQEEGGGVAEGLAYDGDYIYFSRCQDDTIGRVRPDGTELDTAFITVINGCPQGLDVADGYIYWTTLGGGEGDPSRIGRAATTGGSLDGYWLLTNDELGPIDVAVSHDHVFWSHGVSEAEGGYNYIGRASTDATGVDPRFIDGTGGTKDRVSSAIAVSHPPPSEGEDVEEVTVTENGLEGLELGTPFTTAKKSALVASIGKGCELGGPPVPPAIELAPPLQGVGNFYTQPDELALTDLTLTAGVVTPEGIRIGSTADDVIAAYPEARVVSGVPGEVLQPSQIVIGSRYHPKLTFILNHDGGVVTTIGVPNQSICE